MADNKKVEAVVPNLEEDRQEEEGMAESTTTTTDTAAAVSQKLEKADNTCTQQEILAAAEKHTETREDDCGKKGDSSDTSNKQVDNNADKSGTRLRISVDSVFALYSCVSQYLFFGVQSLL